MAEILKEVKRNIKMREKISEEIGRKTNKLTIKVNKNDFFDNYDEQDINSSDNMLSLIKLGQVGVQETGELVDPYTVIDREQFKYYEEYENICNDANKRIEELIEKYANKYYEKFETYKKQALDEKDNL